MVHEGQAKEAEQKYTGYTTFARARAEASSPDVESPRDTGVRGQVNSATKKPTKKSARKQRTHKSPAVAKKRARSAKATSLASARQGSSRRKATSAAPTATARAPRPAKLTSPPPAVSKSTVPATTAAAPKAVAAERPSSAAAALKVDAGVIKPSAGSASSPQLAINARGFLPWGVIVPLAVALSGVLFWGRRRRRPEPAEPPVLQDPVLHLDPGDVATASAVIKADLLKSAEPFYRDLQLANSRKDHEFFHQHCTEALATSMILDSETTSESAQPQVDVLKAELVDLFEEVNRYVASVQYTASVQEGNRQPRKVTQLFHFVREPDAPAWRLAAVEPNGLSTP